MMTHCLDDHSPKRSAMSGQKRNLESELSDDERRRAADITVWIVWYEDRFGWGPDRDPASALSAFATENEAKEEVDAKGGPPDTQSGQFDGYFHTRSDLLAALQLGVISLERARELLDAR
jgi:hypothetical protein